MEFFLGVILPIAVVVATGWMLQQRGYGAIETLTHLSLYVLSPSLVFHSLVTIDASMMPALGQGALYMLAYTLVVWLVSLVVGRLFFVSSGERAAFSMATAVMNSGNYGLPLVAFAYGAEALPYAIMTFVLFTFPLGTLAIGIAQVDQFRWGTALKNVASIPIFHAMVLAMLLRWLGVVPIKGVLDGIELMGQAAVPVMLLLLGMQLCQARAKILGLFPLIAAVVRLAVGPVIGILLCELLGIEGLLRKVLILQSSTPSAVLTLLYAIRFQARADLVASAIVITTFLSPFSLMLLYHYL